MILIFDNGQEYNDHTIDFIDIGILKREIVVPWILEHMHESGDDNAFFIAAVERVEWIEDGSLVPIAVYWESVWNHTCAVRGCREAERNPFERLANIRGEEGTAAAQAMVGIEGRVWTPAECPCTCASGKLRDLAEEAA